MEKLLIVSLLLILLIGDGSKMFVVPSQFYGEYLTVAHQIPMNNEYPASRKEYRVYYDGVNKMGRYEYKNEEGIEFTYIRNYRDHYEVKIENLNGKRICEYSYLGTPFPEVYYADSIQYYATNTDGARQVDVYTFQDYRQYIEMKFDTTNGYPYRYDEFYIKGENKAVPVYSIIYKTIKELPNDESLFEVLSLVNSGECIRTGKGWPYQHIFGPFVRI